jgi:hypothetical protein
VKEKPGKINGNWRQVKELCQVVDKDNKGMCGYTVLCTIGSVLQGGTNFGNKRSKIDKGNVLLTFYQNQPT